MVLKNFQFDDCLNLIAHVVLALTGHVRDKLFVKVKTEITIPLKLEKEIRFK